MGAENLDTANGRLARCPSSPNCVCSDSERGRHSVEPLRFRGDPQAAWEAVQRVTLAMPRTRIVQREPGYLRAECRSALMGFVDDLELELRASEQLIAVRSASRLGWSDMGVNRRRVEELRRRLEVDGFLP